MSASNSDSTALAVLVTIDSLQAAKELSAEIVSAKNAACVNIVSNVLSVYSWEGVIKSDDECLMIIKTDSSKVETLRKQIKERHPYDVPEFIAFKIEAGDEDYLGWLRYYLSG